MQHRKHLTVCINIFELPDFHMFLHEDAKNIRKTKKTEMVVKSLFSLSSCHLAIFLSSNQLSQTKIENEKIVMSMERLKRQCLVWLSFGTFYIFPVCEL